jgi:gluconolactonase
MKKFIALICCSIVFQTTSGQKLNKIVSSGNQVKKLSGDFSFTEGPASDQQGNVFFTDQPNNKIYEWTVDGKLILFNDDCGRANGLYFNKNGNLLSCSDLKNEIWSFDRLGYPTVLVSGFQGKRLNGPNDLWIHPNGGIYFTDPLYPRSYWTDRDSKMLQDGQHVYYLSPDHQSLIRVTSDLVQPNGIIGTADGKILYVADIKAGKTYQYKILPDGNLSDKKLFAPMGSDGMTIDNKGNIYLTGKGVTVFDSKGNKLGNIPVDARWTANVCFGGRKMKTLFITASESLFSLDMKVKGIR